MLGFPERPRELLTVITFHPDFLFRIDRISRTHLLQTPQPNQPRSLQHQNTAKMVKLEEVMDEEFAREQTGPEAEEDWDTDSGT